MVLLSTSNTMIHLMGKIKYIQTLEQILSDARKDLQVNVYKARDFISDLTHARLHGESEGEFAGFTSLHPHLRFVRGYFTVFTGYPGSGKSQVIQQLSMVQAVKRGRKVAMYSPESYPVENLVNELIRCYLGKNIDTKYDNVCTDEEYEEGISFVHENYFFLRYPDMPRLDQLLTDYHALAEQEGVEIFITDPFNAVAESSGEDNISKYLKTSLTQMKMFAVDMKVFNWVVEHPRSPKLNQDGSLPLCTPWTLMGGSMWWAKLDQIVSVERIQDSSQTGIRVWKVKMQRLNGVPNPHDPVYLTYKINENRYHEGIGVGEQDVEEVF